MEYNVMPRILLLGTFLALGFVAFVADGLFASGPEVKTKAPIKLKQKESGPSNTLAKLLRASDKKSSTKSKLASKKKTSRIKSSHHKLRSSKSLSSRKKIVSKKTTYSKGKSKSLKKAIRHRAKPAKKLMSDRRKLD
jgi:hypothetical protein